MNLNLLVTAVDVYLALVYFQNAKSVDQGNDLREQLEESEKLMKEMSKTWEQKLKETEAIHQVSAHI